VKKLIFVLSAFLLVTLLMPAAQASNFIVTCTYSHSLTDDPIVFPGQPGASHLHDFFGNRTTNASSTYDSMRAGGTTCNDPGDTAGYWSPALILSNGNVLAPTRAKAYYYRNGGTVQAPPANFKLVAGDSHATGEQSTKVVYFGCGNGSGISKKAYIPNCTGFSSFLETHILFPDCWDGVVVDGNEAAHMAYSTMNGGVCPAGYPTRFAQLVLAVFYPTSNASGASFASGPYYTLHADFWNTWDQARFVTRVVAL